MLTPLEIGIAMHARFFSELENFGEIVTYSVNLYAFLFINHFSMEMRREISANLENLPNPDKFPRVNVFKNGLCISLPVWL